MVTLCFLSFYQVCKVVLSITIYFLFATVQGGFINLPVPCDFYQVCKVVTLVEIPGSVKFIVVYCYL